MSLLSNKKAMPTNQVTTMTIPETQLRVVLSAIQMSYIALILIITYQLNIVNPLTFTLLTVEPLGNTTNVDTYVLEFAES